MCGPWQRWEHCKPARSMSSYKLMLTWPQPVQPSGTRAQSPLSFHSRSFQCMKPSFSVLSRLQPVADPSRSTFPGFPTPQHPPPLMFQTSQKRIYLEHWRETYSTSSTCPNFHANDICFQRSWTKTHSIDFSLELTKITNTDHVSQLKEIERMYTLKNCGYTFPIPSSITHLSIVFYSCL